MSATHPGDGPPAGEPGGPDDHGGLPLGAKVAAFVAAVVLVLVLFTSVDLSGGDDAPTTSRTFTGFDPVTTTVPTTAVPTTTVVTTAVPTTAVVR